MTPRRSPSAVREKAICLLRRAITQDPYSSRAVRYDSAHIELVGCAANELDSCISAGSLRCVSTI